LTFVMTKNENVTINSRGNERELINLAKNGDSDAFEKLLFDYKNYVGYIVDTTCWSCGEYREDFMQEGFLALFRAVRTYDGLSSSFSTYAFQCIKNAVITAWRKYERIPKEREFCDTYDRSPEEIVLEQESARLLYERMMLPLSELEKRVVELYADGYRPSQISEKIGIAKKSVDNALARAKRKLGGK